MASYQLGLTGFVVLLALIALRMPITFPEMLRHGYDRKLATGSIASAATLAVLIPPSIVLVIYAVFVQESVGRLLMAGYIPGVLSALLLMGMVYVRVKLYPSLAPL